jgi:hypothetical protein
VSGFVLKGNFAPASVLKAQTAPGAASVPPVSATLPVPGNLNNTNPSNTPAVNSPASNTGENK